MATPSPQSMMVPGDFEITTAGINRRRALLDAMAKQNQPGPGQMVSGHYIAPSWTEQLAGLGSTLANIYGQKNLDSEESDAKASYQSGLGQAVKQYLDTRNGYDKPTIMTSVTPDGSVGTPVSEHVQGDPRKALVDAIASGYQPMAQIGMSDLSTQGKQMMTPKDFSTMTGEGKYTPGSVQKAMISGDVRDLVPMGKVHSVNGQLIDAGGDGGPKVLGDFRDQFGAIGPVGEGPNGPIMGQKNTSTGEAKFAPQGTTVNVDTAQKGAGAFAVKSNEAAVKRLEDSQAQAMKAQGSLGLFQNASNLIQDLPGGLAAQPIQSAKRFLAMFGADDPSITSSEQVNQALKTAILDNAHIFGTGNGFTDKDREELARIVGADPSLSPQTLQYMVNKGLANSINTLRQHEGLVSKMGNAEGADPAVMEAFKVPVPHYSLDGKDFDYDPGTKLLTPKGAGTRRAEAAKTTAPSQGLSPAEQQELATLRARFGGKR